MNDIKLAEILIVWHLLVICHSTDSDSEDWMSACPYNNFCTQKTSLTYNASDGITVPCCSPCSCEPDCWMFDNCCPDVSHERPVGLQKATCSALIATNGTITNICSSSVDLPQYLVIDFCPPALDEEVSSRCEEPLNHSPVLNDLAVVSGSNGRIYKNKHCALCHGVEGVVRWDLLMSCTGVSAIDKIRASGFLRALIEKCVVKSVPPNREEKTKSISMLCGSSLVSDCSESCTTDFTEKCNNGPRMPYMQKVSRGMMMYKNVFCALCNCLPQDGHLCDNVNVSKGKQNLFFSYNVFLDMSLDDAFDTTKKSTLEKRPCGEREIYDHVQNKCRELLCPVLHVAFYGRCIPLGTRFQDFAVTLSILCQPIRRRFISEGISMSDNDYTIEYICKTLASYGLSGCELADFYVNVHIRKRNLELSYILTYLAVFVDDKCSLDYLSTVVSRKLSKNSTTNIVINGKNVKVSGKIFFFDETLRNFFQPDTYDRYTMLYLKVGTIRVILAEHRFFLCPYSILNVTQYTSITIALFGQSQAEYLTKFSVSTRTLDGFYIISENSIAVCVHTYFKLYRKSGEQSGMISNPICPISILILQVFLLFIN